MSYGIYQAYSVNFISLIPEATVSAVEQVNLLDS